MTDSYRTLGAHVEHEPDKTKGSRHIANLFPVTDQQQIDDALASVRARMPDANHHAFAWRLGRGENDFRYSDDGEPSGSAGRPMLQHRQLGLEQHARQPAPRDLRELADP